MWHRALSGLRWAGSRSNQWRGRAQSTEAQPFEAIPGPPTTPGMGTLMDMMQRGGFANVLQIHGDYYREYGKLVKVENGPGRVELLVFDPLEMVKVFQAEAGTYPTGAAAFAWPFQQYYASRGIAQPLLTIGPDWVTRRSQLQRELFTPAAATSYLPLLAPVTAEISAQFPHQQGQDIPKYINRAAFDMFTTIMFGESLHTVLPSVSGRDLLFVETAQRCMSSFGAIFFSPDPQPLLQQFFEGMDVVMKIGREITDHALSQAKKFAVEPYAVRLFNKGELTPDQLATQLTDLLFAGVDTTSHTFLWALLNAARFPAQQERVAAELREQAPDGTLTAENSKNLPLLDAFIRESHRFSPPGPSSALRQCPADLVISGYQVPKGTLLNLMQLVQQDPAIVPDADQFRLERWLPHERDARKGTPAQIIDHVLLSSPFGGGARMCLGARVASREISALLTRLIHDWRIAVDPTSPPFKTVSGLFSMATPYPHLLIQPRV
jgi:cytochrome P450